MPYNARIKHVLRCVFISSCKEFKNKEEMNREEKLQFALCEWLRTQHPDVIFTSESSGLRVPMATAKKLKKGRSIHKLPDLWILEPRFQFHGLILELKTETPYTKSGRLKAGSHLLEQEQTLNQLTKKGYLAQFSWGFERTKALIENYLK